LSYKIHNSFVLASDHAGYDLKEQIKFYLENNNFKVKDLGPFNNDSVDYPDYGKVLGDFIASNKNIIGIAICGTGIGISIALNRVSGVRAALCHNIEIAKLARNHNNANAIVFGGRFININDAVSILDVFIKEDFEGGRHKRRVDKLN
jgi:ribose 5-phosphate isomerase B